MNKILVMLVVVLFVGCAHHRSVWRKPNFDKQQGLQDFFACKKDVAMMTGSVEPDPEGNLFGARNATFDRYMSECMQAKGYHLERATD